MHRTIVQVIVACIHWNHFPHSMLSCAFKKEWSGLDYVKDSCIRIPHKKVFLIPLNKVFLGVRVILKSGSQQGLMVPRGYHVVGNVPIHVLPARGTGLSVLCRLRNEDRWL